MLPLCHPSPWASSEACLLRGSLAAWWWLPLEKDESSHILLAAHEKLMKAFLQRKEMVRSRQDNSTKTAITSCFDGTSEPGELRGGKLFRREGIANPRPGGPGNLKLGVNVLGRRRTSFVRKRVQTHARCTYPGRLQARLLKRPHHKPTPESRLLSPRCHRCMEGARCSSLARTPSTVISRCSGPRRRGLGR
jgi:hypothetical protein